MKYRHNSATNLNVLACAVSRLHCEGYFTRFASVSERLGSDPHQNAFVWKHTLCFDYWRIFAYTVYITTMENVHRFH